MPVSQEIQDFCAELPVRVSAFTAQQLAQAAAATEAGVQQRIDEAVTAATDQLKQDHADEVAALQAALDQAAPAQPAQDGGASAASAGA